MGHIKASANFIAELNPRSTKADDLQWTVHMDGSSGILLEQAFKLDFKTSNNQVEYEVILVGLNLAYDMEAQQLICRSDSQLVVRQLKGEFEVKESLLQKYYHLVQNLMSKLKNVQIEHIRREHNVKADMLSRLATVKKKGLHQSIIYINLKNPSVNTNKCIAIHEKEN